MPSSGVEGTQQKILGQKGLFEHLLRPWTSGPVEWRPEGAVLLVHYFLRGRRTWPQQPIPLQAELGDPLAPLPRVTSLLQRPHCVLTPGSELPGASGDWVYRMPATQRAFPCGIPHHRPDMAQPDVGPAWLRGWALAACDRGASVECHGAQGTRLWTGPSGLREVKPQVPEPRRPFSSVKSCPTLCNPMDCSMPGSLSITNSRSLLKLISMELVMPFNHLILCHPLLPPSIFPSIRVFSSESVLHIRWPKYWSFSFSISPSNEYSELISFRMDWLDLLAVQQHNSKAKDDPWRT